MAISNMELHVLSSSREGIPRYDFDYASGMPPPPDMVKGSALPIQRPASREPRETLWPHPDKKRRASDSSEAELSGAETAHDEDAAPACAAPRESKSSAAVYASPVVGSCPGHGLCNGMGGSHECSGCPTYNNVIGEPSPKPTEAATSSTSSSHASPTASVPLPPPSVPTKTEEVASTEPAAQGKKEPAKAGDEKAGHTIEALRCTNCQTTTTPLWRRDEDGNNICNACGLYQKLHGTHRPIGMRKTVIKRRKRLMGTSNQASSGTQTSTSSKGPSSAAPAAAGTGAKASSAAARSTTRFKARDDDTHAGRAERDREAAMVLMEVGSASRWGSRPASASPQVEAADEANEVPPMRSAHDMASAEARMMPRPMPMMPYARVPYTSSTAAPCTAARMHELERLRDELYLERNRLDDLLERTERALTEYRHARYDRSAGSSSPYVMGMSAPPPPVPSSFALPPRLHSPSTEMPPRVSPSAWRARGPDRLH